VATLQSYLAVPLGPGSPVTDAVIAHSWRAASTAPCILTAAHTSGFETYIAWSHNIPCDLCWSVSRLTGRSVMRWWCVAEHAPKCEIYVDRWKLYKDKTALVRKHNALKAQEAESMYSRTQLLELEVCRILVFLFYSRIRQLDACTGLNILFPGSPWLFSYSSFCSIIISCRSILRPPVLPTWSFHSILVVYFRLPVESVF
jgi:hypothetical protein